MAYDIVTTIMDAMVTYYIADMQTALSDEYKLLLIEKAPLQEDPTLVAPFIIVGLDFDQGRVMDTTHDQEIGGNRRWINFFRVGGRVANYTDKNSAYAAIGKLNDLALKVLFDHSNLGGLTADNGEQVCDITDNFVDKNAIRVYGGESEWFGELYIEFHVFSEE